jgi:hypothetical protein
MAIFRDDAWRRIFTVFGTARISEAAGPFGAAGVGAFDGSGNYLTVANSSDFDFGSGDFTVEFFFDPTVLPGAGQVHGLIGKRANTVSAFAPLIVYVDGDTSKLWILGSTTGTTWGINFRSSITLTAGQWYYVALKRGGNTLTLWADGAQVASATVSGALMTNSADLSIGAAGMDGGYPAQVYLSNLRITKGIARDVSVVPTGPFPIGAADPYWANVVLLLPMDFVDVAPAFTAPASPWILQPTPPETYAIQPKTLDARAESLLDQWWGGMGRIDGTTKIKGTPDAPVSRKVRLFDVRTGLIIRETWSDPVTGAYAFTGLDPARDYLALAHDHTRQYNAVVADRLTPEPMP